MLTAAVIVGFVLATGGLFGLFVFHAGGSPAAGDSATALRAQHLPVTLLVHGPTRARRRLERRLLRRGWTRVARTPTATLCRCPGPTRLHPVLTAVQDEPALSAVLVQSLGLGEVLDHDLLSVTRTGRGQVGITGSDPPASSLAHGIPETDLLAYLDPETGADRFASATEAGLAEVLTASYIATGRAPQCLLQPPSAFDRGTTPDTGWLAPADHPDPTRAPVTVTATGPNRVATLSVRAWVGAAPAALAAHDDAELPSVEMLLAHAGQLPRGAAEADLPHRKAVLHLLHRRLWGHEAPPTVRDRLDELATRPAPALVAHALAAAADTGPEAALAVAAAASAPPARHT